MLRRIQKRFDELNIEIPRQQRTIHYHHDDAPTDPEHTRPATVPVGSSAKKTGGESNSRETKA